MKQNDCKIEDCFCKCETKEEHRDWTFRAIQKRVYEEARRDTKNYELAFLHIQHLVDAYSEYCIDVDIREV